MKKHKIYNPNKKKGGFWAGFGLAVLGAVVLACGVAIAVSIGAMVNHIGFVDQAVTWLGGTMPPAEATTPAV